MAVSTVRRGGMSFTLIDDSFNANPDSMRAGLDGLARWRSDADPYRIAVLGAMLELGGDESALHEGIGEYAAGLPIDASSRWATMTSISTRWLPPLRRARGSGVTTVTATRRRCIGFTTSIRPTPWSELLPETMTTRLCC